MRWTREDYYGTAVQTAKRLIGAVLVRETDEGIIKGRITECEAYGGYYRGKNDDGAHSYKGITPRTKVIFGEGGHIYVYLIYGMYWCMNVVCGHKGEGYAVLLRAVEPLEGTEIMKKKRGNAKGAAVDGGARTSGYGDGHRFLFLWSRLGYGKCVYRRGKRKSTGGIIKKNSYRLCHVWEKFPLAVYDERKFLDFQMNETTVKAEI